MKYNTMPWNFRALAACLLYLQSPLQCVPPGSTHQLTSKVVHSISNVVKVGRWLSTYERVHARQQNFNTCSNALDHWRSIITVPKTPFGQCNTANGKVAYNKCQSNHSIASQSVVLQPQHEGPYLIEDSYGAQRHSSASF